MKAWVGNARGRRRAAEPRTESGYALLMALFLVATLALAATLAVPTVFNQGQREKELELEWRGKQYVRAIQHYYQKTGHYPQTVDDLMMTDAANIHYLRKVYKDPVSTTDGSWRFIYVAPTGQLIGSVRYHSLQEMAAMLGFNMQAPSAAGAAAAAAASGQGVSVSSGSPTGTSTGTSSDANAQSNSSQPNSSQTGNSQNGQQPGTPAGQQPNPQASPFGLPGVTGATPAGAGTLAAVDGPVFGASLIGVASKVKRPSIRVYQGGKTYFQWEFIYNPLTVTPVAGAAQPGAQSQGTAQQGQPQSASPGGATINGGSVPGQNPGGMPSGITSPSNPVSPQTVPQN